MTGPVRPASPAAKEPVRPASPADKEPVRPASPADKEWASLAAELMTPAKTLARVDSVTARTVTTVTIIGVLLTGLGVLTAGRLTQNAPARGLAIAAVIAAALAVASALIAQILTITRDFHPANLLDVKAWYDRQFRLRAYPTQAATVLVLLAALLAGGASTATLLTDPPAADPVIEITQSLMPTNSIGPVNDTHTTVTVRGAFPGLTPAQTATITVTTAGVGRVIGIATATPGADGTAVTSLTVSNLTAGKTVIVIATAGHHHCRAVLNTAKAQPALKCGYRS